jgi:hypothetical protein
MPKSSRQQQRKNEDPEDDFGLAPEFEDARPEQMTVSGPAAVAAASRERPLRRLIVISVEVRRIGFCGCHSIFSQVTPGELHEDVFEAGLARAQVFELMAVAGYRIQKRGDGEMRLADT